MITAETLTRRGIKNVGLLFDVCEETDFSGILKAINLINPRFVIVGEPTSLKIVNGQKGLLGIKIICEGKSAPGATPEKGDSAISKLLNQLNIIRRISYPKNTFGNTTFNIGQIKGGSAPNVVPDYAEAIIEFRTICSNEAILNLLNSLKIEYEIVYSYDFCVSDKFGINYSIAPYFTEMYFWNKKAKVIVIGPGDYEDAHSDNEKVSKEEVKKAVEEYLQIITYLNKQLLRQKKQENKK
jgi:acetylornithine deacetylase/succinyl-diaminopimelate desuccinylase-like protein